MSIAHAKGAASRRTQPAQASLPDAKDANSARKAARSGASANPQPVKNFQARSASVWTKKDTSKSRNPEDFVSLFRKDPLEHVGLLKHGVSALLTELVAGGMGVSKDKVLATLGLASATIQRKARIKQSLSAEESSRVLAISRLSHCRRRS